MIVQEEKKYQVNYTLKLTVLWLLGAVSDRLWLAFDKSVPAWDQADYLTGSLTYWHAFQNTQLFSGEWWTHFWELSPKVPPLTYILAVPFQTLFGRGADEATLVHLLFSAILLTSVYYLGSKFFNPKVGFWAATLCILFPGLYRYRLQFLLDYPLTAMVTSSFCCLTFWYYSNSTSSSDRSLPETHLQTTSLADEIKSPSVTSAFRFPLTWLWATAFGLTFGLAILVKQTTIFFLLMPLLWVGINILRKRQWLSLIQLIYSVSLSVAVCYPWVRTNWLLILTAGKRATVDSAIAEGDPNLLSLDAWFYYLKLLPYHLSLPLLIIPMSGFIFYIIRSIKKIDKRTNKTNWEDFRWLGVFLIGSYLICSLNINKDFRYTLPLLPVLSILLAACLMQFPIKIGQKIRNLTVGLAVILMMLNLWPVPGMFLRKTAAWLSPGAVYYAHLGQEWPQRKVIAEIVKSAPYLQSTLGVLPSTPEINQHNLNYYGALQNFQVYGRQVGTNLKQVPQDARSLSWFITKTNEQGSVNRIEKAQAAIVNTIEQSQNFQLQKSWQLPDNSNLNLYHSQFLPVEVHPLTTPQEKVKLDYVILSPKIRPGEPIPITYKWSGSWENLQSGLVLLTYQRENKRQEAEGKTGKSMGILLSTTPPLQTTINFRQSREGEVSNLSDEKAKNLTPVITKPSAFGLSASHLSLKPVDKFIHDHGIGMGTLHSGLFLANESQAGFEVIERMGVLPPADIIPGTYFLEATYLNRETGETYPIVVQPPVRVQVDSQVQKLPAPELDLVTQLRMLAQKLPQGIEGLETVFEEVGRVNQYDPVQDYTKQAETALVYRLQQEPDNLEWAYGLALARVLQKDGEGAIAALTKVTELDSQNPYAYAYLAFVYLYNLNPGAAQIALKSALEIAPNQPEIKALNGIAALMQGNLIQAWRYIKSITHH